MSDLSELANLQRVSATERLVRLDPSTGGLTKDCIMVNFTKERVTDLI